MPVMCSGSILMMTRTSPDGAWYLSTPVLLRELVDVLEPPAGDLDDAARIDM
jgi:hypothetical protein